MMFRRSVLLLVLVLCNPISFALADYIDDYQLAVMKIEAGEYQNGISLLNTISEFRQQEKQSLKLKNGRSIVYLPKYYKGLAHFYLGQCAEAVSNFQSSDVQRTIRNFKKQYSLLNKMREVCKSHKTEAGYVNKLAPLTQKAEKHTRQLEQTVKAIEKMRREPLMASAWDKGAYFNTRFQNLKKHHSKAQRAVQQFPLTPYSSSARSAIEKQVNNLENQNKAGAKFLDEIKTYSQTLKNIQGRLQAAEKSFHQFLGLQKLPALAEDWKPGSKLSDELTALSQQRVNLTNKIKKLFVVNSENTLTGNLANAVNYTKELEEFEQRVSRLIDYANQIIARVNNNLQEEKKLIYAGVNAFFGGRYTQAVSMLNQADVQDERSRYYKNLFIAAAYFYNPLLNQTEAREKATPYAKIAKAISSKEDFDVKAFSPKFLAFYRSVN